MVLSEDELSKLLDEQRRIELEVANSLEETLKMTENKIVKLLIHSIIMDSFKHSDILEALKDISKGYILSHVEKYEVKKGIEKHIAEEEKMLGKITELVEKVENPKFKNLLVQIQAEEDRHHEALNQLYMVLDKVGDFSEEDWWDYFNKWANFST